jgi:hypothetical protein
MAVYQVETEGGVYEVQTEDQPEKMVGSVFGKVPESAYNAGERNILGNVFERPGAAIRSAIQGKGYTAGAVNPTNVPTFQDLAIQKSQFTQSPVANAALGMIPSALGMAADIATNPADVLTGIVPGLKPVQSAGRAIASTRAGKALTELATMPIEQIGRPTAEQLATKVSTTVKQGIEKAVRPSVIGKRTATQQESYFKKAESAVKDVLDNKANLEIIDKNGGLVVGKNPESLNEALQAVGQTRENIFETYSPMIKQASDAGAVVDGNAIASRLKTFAAQENVQLSNPGLAKYADDVATRWEGKQVPLNVAEQTAKDFNAMLKQKYQQGRVSGADISSAHVDDMVVRMLRNEIADKAGVGDLKRRYGALAELEGDIAKRAIVSGRQNPVGLVDSIASIESGADIAGAVAMSAFTGNPMWLGLAVRGIGAKAAGNIIKGINSPDANIARMFKNVEKMRAIPTKKIITPSEAVNRPMTGRGQVSEADIIVPSSGALPDKSTLREYTAPAEQIGTSIGSRKALPNKSAEGQGRPGYSETYPMRGQKRITDTGSRSVIPMGEKPNVIESGSTSTPKRPEAIEQGGESVPLKKTPIPSRGQSTSVGAKQGKTPIPKKAVPVVVGGTAIGMAGNANASTDIDMNKVYSIESSNNPNAHNKSSNAKGLGQITPIVLKEWNNLNPKDKHSDADLFKADVNKKIASWYMNKRIPQMLKAKGLKDTLDNRLVAYNAGISKVGKILPRETADYIKKYKKEK